MNPNMPVENNIGSLQPQMAGQPGGSFLIENAPVVSLARDLQNNDAVVVIEDAGIQKGGDDIARGERCCNNPDRLPGMAIIHRSFERSVKALVVDAG